MQGFEIAKVFDDVIGLGEPLFTLRLGAHDVFDLLSAVVVPGHGAFHLYGFGDVDYQYPIAPGMLPCLQQQRVDQHDIG